MVNISGYQFVHSKMGNHSFYTGFPTCHNPFEHGCVNRT